MPVRAVDVQPRRKVVTFLMFLIITFRNGVECMRRYYPGHKSLYTNSGRVHGCQEDTYMGPEDIFASGARDFFASAARHFLIWGVRSTQIFVSRGVFT